MLTKVIVSMIVKELVTKLYADVMTGLHLLEIDAAVCDHFFVDIAYYKN